MWGPRNARLARRSRLKDQTLGTRNLFPPTLIERRQEKIAAAVRETPIVVLYDLKLSQSFRGMLCRRGKLAPLRRLPTHGEDGMADSVGRQHYWDALRAVLMLLGIPYHAAMVYDVRVIWDIQSPTGSPFLTLLAGALVTFRMPAFFIVAGFFAAMLLSRRPPAVWVRGRMIRLGLPFLTGLVLLAPLQVAFIDLADAVKGVTSMTDVVARTTRDIIHPGAHWIMHLWFLPALMIYSSLLAAIWHPLHRWQQGLARLASASPWLLVVGTLVLCALIVDLAAPLLVAMKGPLPDLLRHGVDPYLRYLPYFALGVVFFMHPATKASLVWKGGLILPLLALASSLAASVLRGRPELLLPHSAIDALAAVLMSLWLIGLAERYFTRANSRIDALVDASFTIYLFHHPLIFAFATVFLLVSWPPVIEFALIATASFVLSYAIHQALRRLPLGLLFFNGVVPSTGKPGDRMAASADRSNGTLR